MNTINNQLPKCPLRLVQPRHSSFLFGVFGFIHPKLQYIAFPVVRCMAEAQLELVLGLKLWEDQGMKAHITRRAK